MIFSLLKKKSHDYDLFVVGESLSALVSLHAAHQHGLKVAWLLSKNISISAQENKEDVFDSLAPEGLHYLRHIIDENVLTDLERGRFKSVEQQGIKKLFDDWTGYGLQINMQALKAQLKHSLPAKIPKLHSSKHYFSQGKKYCLTVDGQTLSAQWVINAEGKHSRSSAQPVHHVSSDLWVGRSLLNHSSAKKDQVAFRTDEQGWVWDAYDAKGVLCQTRFNMNCKEDGALFNSRWYRREQFIETDTNYKNPVLLTVPTAFRFDPACGLGATLQIKSALLAVRCVKRAQVNASLNIQAAQTYNYQLEESFNEISTAMKPFYRQYGVEFFEANIRSIA